MVLNMNSKIKKNKVVIIGAGIFGSEIAITLAQSGFAVSIIESKSGILQGASGNNLNRIHVGFHYPRDLETAKQAYACYDEFKTKYASCTSAEFLNYYLIANKGSLTSPDNFFEFCNKLGAPHKKINSTDLSLLIHEADSGIACEESVYDFSAMRNILLRKFAEHGISLTIGNGVDKLEKKSDHYSLLLQSGDVIEADIVINASYADINRLANQAGIELDEMQYEYTVIPIIEAEMPKVGVTIMDGPFTSILPRGFSEQFLLYHVEHSVLAREISSQVSSEWLNPLNTPFSQIDKRQYFSKMIESCSEFLPTLKGAKLCGYLEGPRVVQSKKDDTDARPSVLKYCHGDSYISLLSGKVDSSIWVAKNIRDQLIRKFS